jgi:NTE family protein
MQALHLARRRFAAQLATSVAAASALSWGGKADAQTATRRIGKLGLVLGGGSARGFSHIGVLKALEESGYRADVVVGTSAGSLVGAFYAAGYSPWQMEEVALKVRDIDVADFNSANKRGMLAGEALQKLVNDYVRQQPIDKLKLTFGAVATNLHTGEPVLLRTGDTGQAVRASSAIPGVFVPTMVGGQELVDGGLVSPLPVRFARTLGASQVIAIDVGTKPQNNVGNGLYEVILQSFEIMGRALTQLEAKEADVVIRPDTSRFSSTDFGARKDLIQAGYMAGRNALVELKARIAPNSKAG